MQGRAGNGVGVYSSTRFNDGIKYRRVISLTFRPYYSRIKSALYPLNRSLSVSHSWMDRLGNSNFRAPAETQTLDRLILVTIPTALSQINSTKNPHDTSSLPPFAFK